jgi:hypothetical protein
MCTATRCVETRRYIFIPQRVHNIYCLSCVETVFHLFDLVGDDSEQQCVKCSKTSCDLYKLRFLVPGINSPVACKICIKLYKPDFQITRDYIEASKFNNDKLCKFYIRDQKRICMKESCYTSLKPLISTSLSSSTTYCSKHMKQTHPANQRK